MIANIWAFFSDPTWWHGEFGIPHRLLQHLTYTAIVIALAVAIAVPLGLIVGHVGRGRWLVTVANALRAVPTLGLLLAATLWIGPRIHSTLAFVIPSVLVLVLLAIPPILAGTYAGIEAVDPSARDAAEGVGMTGWESLWQVEVPCALPLMLSGIRSAVLQVVATATIAAYVGMGGLGRFLIDGVAQADYAQAAGGALLVALLALVVDALLALLQRLVVSPGLTGRRPRRFRGGNDSRASGMAERQSRVDAATSV